MGVGDLVICGMLAVPGVAGCFGCFGFDIWFGVWWLCFGGVIVAFRFLAFPWAWVVFRFVSCGVGFGCIEVLV